MTQLLEKNTVIEERERFRRPQKTANTFGNTVQSDLRRAACHGVHARRQGRPTATVREHGISRVQISANGRANDKPISTHASYPVMGKNVVETVFYTDPKQSIDQGLVWINKTQYFKGVPLEVWNFRLGGCQICQKWLKDREGKLLSNRDIKQYQRIVIALKEMVELMAGIDAAIHQGQFKQKQLSTIADR